MALKINLVENDTKSLSKPMETENDKAIKHFEGELIKIRTGRAHTSLIEDIQVSAYAQPPVSLKSLAVLAAPEVRLLTIQPWDPSVIGDIEKALQQSELGVTPLSDGKIIRIQLPQMTTNRRDELLKLLGKKAEEAKISIRNIRKDFNNLIKDAKKDKVVSENFYNRLEDLLQQITDKYTKMVDDLAKKKEADLKTV